MKSHDVGSVDERAVPEAASELKFSPTAKPAVVREIVPPGAACEVLIRAAEYKPAISARKTRQRRTLFRWLLEGLIPNRFVLGTNVCPSCSKSGYGNNESCRTLSGPVAAAARYERHPGETSLLNKWIRPAGLKQPLATAKNIAFLRIQEETIRTVLQNPLREKRVYSTFGRLKSRQESALGRVLFRDEHESRVKQTIRVA
jgi:hypothetical protein